MVIFGFLTLYSLDKVYTEVATVQKQPYHSANALLSGLFFASLFSGFLFGIIIFGGIKFILYLRQVADRTRNRNRLPIIFSSFRILCGFLIPPLLWIVEVPGSYNFCITLVLIAEFIDRIEFYDSLKMITPRKQMMMDLEKML